MTTIKFLIAGLLFCLVTVSAVRAQVTIDVSKFTCKEFLARTVTQPDHVAYWLSGYYNGKRSNTVLDINALLDYVSKVEDYCLHSPDVMVMKAAETLLGVNK